MEREKPDALVGGVHFGSDRGAGDVGQLNRRPAADVESHDSRNSIGVGRCDDRAVVDEGRVEPVGTVGRPDETKLATSWIDQPDTPEAGIVNRRENVRTVGRKTRTIKGTRVVSAGDGAQVSIGEIDGNEIAGPAGAAQCRCGAGVGSGVALADVRPSSDATNAPALRIPDVEIGTVGSIADGAVAPDQEASVAEEAWTLIWLTTHRGKRRERLLWRGEDSDRRDIQWVALQPLPGLA